MSFITFPTTRIHFSYVFLAVAVFFGSFSGLLFASNVFAAENQPTGSERLITVHERDKDIGFLTTATTLRTAFEKQGLPIDDNDLVEPGLDEELVAKSYQVNVYRARPVIVVDGMATTKLMSAYQTADQIVRNAGIKLRDEDKTSVDLITNITTHGAGLKVTIDRATSFTLVLYGKKTTAYTQAKTVGDMLVEKDITLDKKDSLSVKKTAAIKEGIKVEIYRNGKQTITQEKPIDFAVQQIQDADRKVGYRKVTTPGVEGKRVVTYEVMMKNGKELKRTEIKSVIVKKPSKQVEIVGAKPSFGGDFAAALAKLRSCEGGYGSINNRAPDPANWYYGAYQFNDGTWGNYQGYKHASDAPGAVQDAAARALYERRGWSPWPTCAASLPDIYR